MLIKRFTLINAGQCGWEDLSLLFRCAVSLTDGSVSSVSWLCSPPTA